MSRAREESGFTLVEVLVATTMALVVFAASLTALNAFQKNDHLNQLRQETQDHARTAMDRLAHELRDAIAATTGTAGALEEAEPYSVVFLTVNGAHAPESGNPTDAMRVRYCLNDTKPNDEVLWRQVIQKATLPTLSTTTTCPDPSTTDWESSTQLVQHITNMNGGDKERPLFKYGPQGASEASQYDAVEAKLYLNLTPAHEVSEIPLTTAVSLRNANLKPIAAFTVTTVLGKNQVKLDASESRDPDGLALTYKWWNGSEALTSTAQQLEVELSAGTHKIKLEVTDPGGLTSSIEKEVTIS